MNGYSVTLHRTEEVVLILEAQDEEELKERVQQALIRTDDDVWIQGRVVPLRSWISHQEITLEYTCEEA